MEATAQTFQWKGQWEVIFCTAFKPSFLPSLMKVCQDITAEEDQWMNHRTETWSERKEGIWCSVHYTLIYMLWFTSDFCSWSTTFWLPPLTITPNLLLDAASGGEKTTRSNMRKESVRIPSPPIHTKFGKSLDNIEKSSMSECYYS